MFWQQALTLLRLRDGSARIVTLTLLEIQGYTMNLTDLAVGLRDGSEWIVTLTLLKIQVYTMNLTELDVGIRERTRQRTAS